MMCWGWGWWEDLIYDSQLPQFKTFQYRKFKVAPSDGKLSDKVMDFYFIHL